MSSASSSVSEAFVVARVVFIFLTCVLIKAFHLGYKGDEVMCLYRFAINFVRLS